MDPVELAVFAEQALTIQVACRKIPHAH